MPADILISKLENIKGWFVYFVSVFAFASALAVSFAYCVDKFSTKMMPIMRAKIAQASRQAGKHSFHR